MKVSYAESNVLGSGGLGPSQSFQIRTNAHAFKMLSSGLYSDKIAAVLREIGCNAHDAHIFAGTPTKPITVKLPNAIDDQFWIKDEGPGLSYDDVMGLYTTYFASTKQNSDDFTGGFGLGSKSPFSYTDSFIITSCHGGKRRTFTAHIDNEGSPKIAMMGEEDDTATGVTISFAVKPSDFKAFQEKAQQIFQYFNPLPTILGGAEIKPITFKQDYGHYAIPTVYQDMSLLMGNVVYPLNMSVLRGKHPIIGSFAYSTGVLVRVPIGTVNVAASREELQYDQKTIDAIVAAFTAIRLSIATELAEAWKLVKDWPSRCTLYHLYQDLRHGIALDTNVLADAGVADPDKLYEACVMSYVALDFSAADKDLVIALYYDAPIGGKGLGYRMEKSTANYSNGILRLPLNMHTVLVHGIATLGASRIRKALVDGKYTHMLAIYPAVGKVVAQSSIDAMVAKVRAACKGMEEVDLASLPRMPVAPRAKNAKPSTMFPDGEVRHEIYDGLPVSAYGVPDGERVYVVLQDRHRHHSQRLLCGNVSFNEYQWSRLIDRADVIQEFIPFAKPIYIHAKEYKRMNIESNPDWEVYTSYLQRFLTDDDTIEKLQKIVKNYSPSLDSYGGTPIMCLLRIKDELDGVYKKIAPALKKQKLYKEIEKAHAYKNATVQPNTKIPALVKAYTEVIQSIDYNSVGIIPALNREEHIINTRLATRFDNIDYSLVARVAELSQAACVTLLTEAISKEI